MKIVKTSPEKVEQIKVSISRRLNPPDPAYVRGAVRADLRYIRDMMHEAKVGDFTVIVDEPEHGGGTNKGPNPLSYFLVGAAACLMNQYVRLAAVDGLDIEELEVTARGHFQRKLKGAFERMIYDIRIKSSNGAEAMKNLASKAEDFCYVHNTLIKAEVVMETNLYLNGNLILQKP